MDKESTSRLAKRKPSSSSSTASPAAPSRKRLNGVCVLCKTNKTDDKLNMGELHECDGVMAHYFCLLFSAALVQNSDDQMKYDKVGICGFLPDDIIREARRGLPLFCVYCDSGGATIGCSVKRCRISYHLPCGILNKVSFQFLDKFESYCPAHAERREAVIPRNWTCPVCMDDVTEYDDDHIVPTCCLNAAFHKACVQTMAISSGVHFFKCPCCNEKDAFVSEMKRLGVYVPQQDASWEKEPGAFQELLARPTTCDAEACKCDKGRQFDDIEFGQWEIIRCQDCGSSAIHRECGQIPEKIRAAKAWHCPACKVVDDRVKQTKKEEAIKKRKESFKLKKYLMRSRPSFLSTIPFNLEMRPFLITNLKVRSSAKSSFPITQSMLSRLGNTDTIPDYTNATPVVKLENRTDLWKNLHEKAKLQLTREPDSSDSESDLNESDQTVN